jgi:hypothetical protein
MKNINHSGFKDTFKDVLIDYFPAFPLKVRLTDLSNRLNDICGKNCTFFFYNLRPSNASDCIIVCDRSENLLLILL